MRFLSIGESPQCDTLAKALPAELIAGMSRVKWLHVIARGSSFRFDPQTFDPADVARHLNVGYIVTGLVEPFGSGVSASLEIQSAADDTLVWSDRFSFDAGDVQMVRGEIVSTVISALELSVPQFEAMRSRRLSADQFDAWSHFHLGLAHAFRFSPNDNQLAAGYFKQALTLDPHFSRAHSGMSFVHWQNAFLRMEDGRQEHLNEAISEAKQALEINPDEPFANFCMGRALWLSHDAEASVAWLDRGLKINPNYAHCHYTKGLVLNMKGDYVPSHSATKRAMALSPLDPLYYGMLANQTLNEIAQDNLDGAMVLAEKAVHSPGTYYYPVLWAAIAAELSGQRVKMQRWRDRALAEWPDASVEAMMQTFPLEDPVLIRTVEGSLRRMGIP
ncbi:MAG: transcriptional regulator [Pseudomonadota bacterium]